jgi:apolipoprotein D and lipocalin family protein
MNRLILLALLLHLSAGCHEAPLDVAPDVDLLRFQGQWYEIAKLPRPTQVDCTATTASYRLVADGELHITNACRLGHPGGTLRQVVASAKVTDRAVPAKLSVDFGGFYGDYWILEVGPTYEYAVIGHPTRQYLWILSRSTELSPATLGPLLERIALKGFNTERLEYTLQRPSPPSP